jgi:hypothetical protein
MSDQSRVGFVIDLNEHDSDTVTTSDFIHRVQCTVSIEPDSSTDTSIYSIILKGTPND